MILLYSPFPNKISDVELCVFNLCVVFAGPVKENTNVSIIRAEIHEEPIKKVAHCEFWCKCSRKGKRSYVYQETDHSYFVDVADGNEPNEIEESTQVKEPHKEIGILSFFIIYTCVVTMSDVKNFVQTIARVSEPEIKPYEPFIEDRERGITKEMIEKGTASDHLRKQNELRDQQEEFKRPKTPTPTYDQAEVDRIVERRLKEVRDQIEVNNDVPHRTRNCVFSHLHRSHQPEEVTRKFHMRMFMTRNHPSDDEEDDER